MGRAAALVAALFFPAAAQAASGDIEAGRAKSEICAPCHGEKGISATAGVPNLAGNADLFLQWQLVFFRNGRRHSEIMNPIAAELTDEDVRNLGAYFHSLSPREGPPATDPDPALSEAGRAVAQLHRCANCHTDSFAGKGAASRLTDQREEYLAKALADYRSSARPSTGVAAMTEAAATLSDADIAAVAHFLAYLPGAP